MNFSCVAKITIPEGNVVSISIGNVTIWSATDESETDSDRDAIIANVEKGEKL